MSSKSVTKATKNHLKDPWARFEAWRHDPRFSKAASFRKVFPGFFWGLGAFVIACGLEHFFSKPQEQKDHPQHQH